MTAFAFSGSMALRFNFKPLPEKASGVMFKKLRSKLHCSLRKIIGIHEKTVDGIIQKYAVKRVFEDESGWIVFEGDIQPGTNVGRLIPFGFEKIDDSEDGEFGTAWKSETHRAIIYNLGETLLVSTHAHDETFRTELGVFVGMCRFIFVPSNALKAIYALPAR